MKKILKRTFFTVLAVYAIIMAYPIGYFVLDQNQDVSCFLNTENKKYEGVGAYVINLDRSPERFDYVIGNLNGLGVPVHRISAVDGKKLQDEELSKFVDFESLKITYKHAYKGAIGCSLSHIKAWETFLKSDYEFAIIFEDDVGFDPKKLKVAIDDLIKYKNFWDVCTFNMYLHKNKVHKGLTSVNLSNDEKLLTYLKTTPCTGCYILNRSAALKYLEKKFPIKFAVDDYYSRSWEFGIKFRGIEPCLVYQEYGSSDLSQTENMKNLDANTTINQKIKQIIYRMQKTHIAFFYNLYSHFLTDNF